MIKALALAWGLSRLLNGVDGETTNQSYLQSMPNEINLSIAHQLMHNDDLAQTTQSLHAWACTCRQFNEFFSDERIQQLPLFQFIDTFNAPTLDQALDRYKALNPNHDMPYLNDNEYQYLSKKFHYSPESIKNIITYFPSEDDLVRYNDTIENTTPDGTVYYSRRFGLALSSLNDTNLGRMYWIFKNNKDFVNKEEKQLTLDNMWLVRTPLTHAVGRFDSSLDAVRLLIDSGAEVNPQNKEIEPPLHVATSYHYHKSFSEIAKLLLEKGADVNRRWEGKTALTNVQELLNLPKMQPTAEEKEKLLEIKRLLFDAEKANETNREKLKKK